MNLSVCQPVSQSISQSASQSVSLSVSQSGCQSMCQSISRSVRQCASQLVCQSSKQHTNKPASQQSTNQSFSQSNNSPINQLNNPYWTKSVNSRSNFQRWSFLRLLAFGKVWKENNNPLICSSAHPTAAHSRGIFVVDRLMVKMRLIRHSPQRLFVTSESYVTAMDLARISRLKRADEIRPDQHAFLPP